MFEWTFLTYYLDDNEVENPDVWKDLVNETEEEQVISFETDVDNSDVFENIPGSVSPSPVTPSPSKKARTGEY